MANNISEIERVDIGDYKKVGGSFGREYRYYGNKYYCGVCHEKSVYLNSRTFKHRDELVKKSASKKRIEEIREWYNVQNDLENHMFWKCYHSDCDLYIADERIFNTNVFRRRTLIKTYTKPTNYKQFWG